jgi:hypothetical protein
MFENGKMTLWVSSLLVSLVLMAGCSRQLNYAAARDWSYIRLPPVPQGQSANSPVYKAARYQIKVCENVAAAYGERAASNSRKGIFYRVIGPVFTAFGAASTGAVALADKDRSDQRALAIVGLGLSLAGAALAVGDEITGGERAESYSKAAASVSDAVSKFRDALREGKVSQPSAVKELVCTLRSSCAQQHVGLRPVRNPRQSSGEIILEEKYVAALCMNHVSPEPVDGQGCSAFQGVQSSGCAELACERALLDGNDQEAVNACRRWSS